MGRRVLRGESSEHSVTIAVAAPAPASAEDAFAIRHKTWSLQSSSAPNRKDGFICQDAPRQAGGRHRAEKALR